MGPPAHSYDGEVRKWNVANYALYIQSMRNNTIPFEEEILTQTQKINEYIMTSLRTMEGLDLRVIQNRFSESESERIENETKKYIIKEMMILKEERLVLTNDGKLFADGIVSDLFKLV